MITDDGWFSWAERVPGPPDKVYAQPCMSELYIPHSAVGWLPGWYSRLFSTERTGLCVHGGVHLPLGGDYTAYAAVSITGWFELNGKLIQFYPIMKSCWGSGSYYPNTRGNAFENAGGAPGNFMQPLTPQQTDSNIRAALDLQDWHKRKNPLIYDPWWEHPQRPTGPEDIDAQLYEHTECTRWGSAATACPSERLRYAWPKIITALNRQEEDPNMADERLDQIFTKIGSTEPVLFTVLDASKPDGTKTIPLSRLDWLNYRARGFIVSDIRIAQGSMNFITGLAHTESHGHVIKPQ